MKIRQTKCDQCGKTCKDYIIASSEFIEVKFPSGALFSGMDSDRHFCGKNCLLLYLRTYQNPKKSTDSLAVLLGRKRKTKKRVVKKRGAKR